MKYKTYVVSLPERTDRRDVVKLYYPFEDMEIVDAYSPDKIPDKYNVLWDNDEFPDIPKAKACFASFCETFKRIAEGDEEWGIFACDDTIFHPNIVKILDTWNPPKDCGFIAFNNFSERARSIQQVLDKVYIERGDYTFYYNLKEVTIDETWGILGAIRKECAKMLYDKMMNRVTTMGERSVKGWTVRVDWAIGLLFNYNRVMAPYKLYQPEKPLAFDSGLLAEVQSSSISHYIIDDNDKLQVITK
tara:strand:- start:85 stop:822 length:738 start_codon:yes stop_codon:yes gene_type:complete